jgi:DNA mismatch repair protein MSH5
MQVFERFEGYHLAQIGRKISETIDLKGSTEEGRTVIMPGIDKELDQMKRTLDSLDDFLNRVARKLSEKMPSNMRKLILSHQSSLFPT